MKISLIAHMNGLGHARRLLHLAYHWLQNDSIQFTLLFSKDQFRKLREEIDLIERNYGKFNKIVLHPIGIPGPEHLVDFRPNYEIDREVIRNLISADSVVSDNALWPILVREDVFIMCHFIWLDYWNLQSNDIKFNRQLLEFENLLFSKVQNLVINKYFTMGRIIKELQPLLKIPLVPVLNFGAPIKRKLNEIWVARGTTTQDEQFIRNWAAECDYAKVNKETWSISNSSEKPLAVIARPGLGTIRDCASFQIPISLVPTRDPELTSNLQISNRLAVNSIVLGGKKFSILPGEIIGSVPVFVNKK